MYLRYSLIVVAPIQLHHNKEFTIRRLDKEEVDEEEQIQSHDNETKQLTAVVL